MTNADKEKITAVVALADESIKESNSLAELIGRLITLGLGRLVNRG